ncbi:MAG: gamma-glutamylcyclotransferase family protein [Acidimicrobiales bacterium]
MSDHAEAHGPSPGSVAWADPATLGDEPPVERVLAVYGTLRPGDTNFDVVGGIAGEWFTGVIRGRRFINPAGRYRGYPAFVAADATGSPGGGTGPAPVPVAVLVSVELPRHWARLDDFEGPGYRRVPIGVVLDPRAGGEPVACRAYVYETLPHPA